MNGLQVPGSSPGIIRRAYLLYRIDDNSTVRAGKFITDYGVYFPDHTIPTRQGIGFDEGLETYNIEYSYQGDRFSGSITADLGRIDDPEMDLDKGVSATGAYALTDSSKVGYSAFFGTQNSNKLELTGPYALLGFTKHFYFLAEADLQFTQPAGNQASTQGFVSYEKIGYEIFQGFHIYALEQTYVYDFGGNFNPTTVNPIYGFMANRLAGFGPDSTGTPGRTTHSRWRPSSNSVRCFLRLRRARSWWDRFTSDYAIVTWIPLLVSTAA